MSKNYVNKSKSQHDIELIEREISSNVALLTELYDYLYTHGKRSSVTEVIRQVEKIMYNTQTIQNHLTGNISDNINYNYTSNHNYCDEPVSQYLSNSDTLHPY